MLKLRVPPCAAPLPVNPDSRPLPYRCAALAQVKWSRSARTDKGVSAVCQVGAPAQNEARGADGMMTEDAAWPSPVLSLRERGICCQGCLPRGAEPGTAGGCST